MDIREIAKKIEQKGGRVYLVGGAVRDEMLGIVNHDYDYSVTGLSPDEFQEIFPEAFVRGKDFAVFDIDGMEFALARKDRKIGPGHTGFDTETDKKLTIEDDLVRRDITINAMARDVLTGELIDPFGGRNDLMHGIVRAVGEHFPEDPLRAYRVARFASQFGFSVEPGTIEMMRALRDELRELSVERVYVEMKKALLTARPERFFEVLKEAGILDVHFKEIYELIGALQPTNYHPEGDAFEHTMVVLKRAAFRTESLDDDRKLEVRFAALMHDLGKGATPEDEYPHHYGHERRGEELARVFCNRIKTPTRLKKCAVTAALEHMRGGKFDDMKVTKKVTFIEKIDKTVLGLDGLQIVVDCDDMKTLIDEEGVFHYPTEDGERDLMATSNINRFDKIGREMIDSVTGDDIMKKFDIEPGPKVAEILHSERVRWYREKVKTT